MLKKTMTYVDFDGEERTEDFYFNLTQAEVTEWELSNSGGLVKFIEKVSKERDSEKIAELFKTLILKSYGEKTLDGKRFVKSEEISNNFKYTNAYSDLYMELAFNAEAASEFIDGVAPKHKPLNTNTGIPMK